MATYSVQTRVFTPDSAVAAQTVYGGTTTYDVIASKDLNIPLGVTSSVVLPSASGDIKKGQVFNKNYYQPGTIGNRQKLFVIATADESNTEDVALYSIASATGTGALVGLETKIGTLSAGESVVYPFRVDSGDTARNLLPNLVACNGTSGNAATTPSLHIAIGYHS